jgi:hypothetical protein
VLIAISQVCNEVQLLPLCVANLLAQGVDVILVADHGSTDGTTEWLTEAARSDPRVQWMRNDDTAFHQSMALTALARVAVAGGATWVLPVDADEMWVATDEASTLKAVLDAHPDAAALRVCPDDFPAPYDLDVFRPGDLRRFGLRFQHSEDESVTEEAVVGLASGEHAYLPHSSVSKWVVRAHPALDIAAGAHAVTGLGPGTTPTTDQIRLLHVPLRDRRFLAEKRRHGARLRDSGYPPIHGWQEQMLLTLSTDDDWARLWQANSVSAAGAMPSSRTCDALIQDAALRRLAGRLERAAPPVPAAPPPRLLREHGLRVMQDLVGVARERDRLTADLDEKTAALALARDDVERLTRETSALRSQSEERGVVIAGMERDLAAMWASRSWRLTRPLRRLASLFGR